MNFNLVFATARNAQDTLSGILDIYLSSVSNGINEVMEVLTAIATIFIPSISIVGISGRNFEDMPELKFPYGYPTYLVGYDCHSSCNVRLFQEEEWILLE